MIARYGSNPSLSMGRLYKEEPDLIRNDYQRDRDRIINSNAFRRLEYKTQVFINHEGDHYRNRLTHSIEVAVISRSLAQHLNLSEELSEAIALAHDLGHTPFGHAGEDALNLMMKNYGGFSHNIQVVKILTNLEKRYSAFNGLNLTWEVLEGIVKHNGPIKGKLHDVLLEYNKKSNLKLDLYPSLEAQLSSLSDDIAYAVHDLEDGVRSSILSIEELFEIDFIEKFYNDVVNNVKGSSPSILIFEIGRKINNLLINDLISNSKLNIKNSAIETCDDVRNYHSDIIAFSDEIKHFLLKLKQLLMERVYKNHKVVRINLKCQRIIRELFDLYMNSPGLLPDNWSKLAYKNETHLAEIVSNYISGMTDRYAIKEYQSFFNINLGNM